MSSGVKIIIAIVVVAVIAGGALLLANSKSDDKKTENTNNSSSQNGTDGPGAGDPPGSEKTADVIITYDGSSFTLSATSIKAGGNVKVVNESDDDLDFDSDPHPVHTDNPELNAGDIEPGGSKTFTLTTKGTWGFHNHLNSSQNGELTVE